MKSVDELIENGYVKVGSKSYCEYWKKCEEVIPIPTDLECFEDGCMNNIKEYFNKENSHKVFCCIVNGGETYLQCYYDVDYNIVEAYSWEDQEDSKNYIEGIQEVVYEVAFQEENDNGYHEEYELSKEDFAKLESYEVSKDIYKYTSIEHLKEILTLLDKPYIDNLETYWDSEFNADLSKLKVDYGLICSYGYMDSWDELVNCCMIIDGGNVG